MEELSRSFGSVQALDGLSLEVPRGAIFGLLGPNGAGKTTAIRLLLGLLRPTRGRAEVLGFDVGTQAGEIRSRAGALLEHTGLYERLSAEDNLEFFGRIWRMPRPKRRARVEELLRHLGLWERRSDLVGVWSAGMKRKLAVARVLLHRPELVILDEPTAGLDPVSASALHKDITELVAREGTTVLLTTHSMTEAELLCYRLAVIHRGRLVAEDSPARLRARGARPRVEILTRGVDDVTLARLRARPDVASAEFHDSRLQVALHGETAVAPLVNLLVSAGVEVEEVRRDRPSLEEAFLQLVGDNP
jgi:ABC-2 type transport system ATP-binding protein